MLFIVFGVTAGLILFAFFLYEAIHRMKDNKARDLLKKYCMQENLEIKEMKTLPGHYGFYFLYDGKKYYANFSVDKGKLKWLQGSPIDKINNKETERKMLLLNRRRIKLFDTRL